MNDITPPRHTSRGRIRPQSRPHAVVNRSSPVRVQSRSVSAAHALMVEEAPKHPVSHSHSKLSEAQKTRVLEEALKKHSKKPRRSPKLVLNKRTLLNGAAALVLVVTGYIGFDVWLTNDQYKQIAGSEVAGVSQLGGDTVAEGRDETALPEDSLKNYEVSADLPRAIYIDKIGVEARVLPMGVNLDNAVQSPINIYDSGWYTGSVRPGEIGAVFINAHASGPTREGLFANLDTLSVGDEIVLEKGDRTSLTYKVVDKEVLELGEVDMKKVLLPKNGVLRGLNLMTCAGEWTADGRTMDKRVVIYTEQIT